MMKRNVLTLVLALALIAALAVGGTLAYFTDNAAADNTFTMGKVEIKLEEDNGSGWSESGLTYNQVLPGDPLTKKARVTVATDSADCYIMMTVALTDIKEYDAATEKGFKIEDKNALYTAIQNAIKPDWTVTTLQDGTLQCVYQNIVKAGGDVTLFEEITIPPSLKNNVAEETFKIALKAYGIQSDNLDLDKVDWAEAFEINLTPVPAE